MDVPNVVTGVKPLRLPERNVHDRLRTELLDFWSRHPRGKYDARAIHYALDYLGKSCVTNALKEMADEGLVVAENCNSVLFYSLAANKDRCA